MKHWRWVILGLWVVVAAVGASRLRWSENIADFLPLNAEQERQMQLYEAHSHANRIVLIVSLADTTLTEPDSLCLLVDRVHEALMQEDDSWPVQTQIDIAQTMTEARQVYEHIPLYLHAPDYAYLDSLMTRTAVREALQRDYSLLMLPASPMTAAIPYDPLGWFTPVVQQTCGISTSEQFTTYDGYMMTADWKTAFLFLDSPYPSSESQRNAQLVDRITKAVEDYPVRLSGAPIIAVSNARCIKRDSVLAMVVALLLIAVLLMRSLSSWRSVGLIIAAVGFGFLTALGLMGVVHPQMSLIVIGIASVIVGIAVNYPLHLIVHRQYTDSPRQTLREVVRPLVIGNITTVGAFLTLLPLHSTALRDLGLFCAAMLVGTIVFTIVFLPYCRFSTPRFDSYSRTSRWLDATSRWQPERRRWMWLGIIVVCTLVLGYFARQVRFDGQLSSINYLTEQQRTDLRTFAAAPDKKTVEVLVENEDPQECIQRWQAFCDAHRDSVLTWLHEESASLGFCPEAFAPFERLMTQVPEAIECPVTLRRIGMATDAAETYMQCVPEAFTLARLQEAMTASLSDNFNRIGWMCSVLVFVFLWISFRRLKYALIAFLPMAVSWVWILGIMSLLGLSFNIVNIILATFIFGQGDDYTIFITEGLIQRRQTGREVLLQYKNAIALSALIMFIGIGTLVIARHPALWSLGIVTVIGMLCVVLLAYILPPLLFRNKQ